MPSWDSLANEYANWKGWASIAAGKIRLSRRARLVRWGKWGIRHNARIGYTEGASRGQWLSDKPPNKLPFSTDCSGFVTLCYKLAGCKDPNGLDYRQLGFTGTLLQHARDRGTLVPYPCPVQRGDLIVFGDDPGVHVVMALEDATDPECVSHGDQAGPERIKLSSDPRLPKRVCRL